MRPVKEPGEVVALPGAGRTEDALKFLNEALAGGARAIVLATVSADGHVRVHIYGEYTWQEVAWVGGVPTREAFD